MVALDYGQGECWNMLAGGSISHRSPIDLLFTYRSLPLRPYKTNKIASHNLGYYVGYYYYTSVVLLL